MALYEGSWLKNYAGTGFVPGDKEWPGASKDYNQGFTFKAGSLEAEYNWFFDQAMQAAKEVGDKYVNDLTKNTGIVPQTEGATIGQLDAENPYLAMFGITDLSGYPEVLLWREYSQSLGIVHKVVVMAQEGNYGRGTTRGMVESFLCQDGLPIYPARSIRVMKPSQTSEPTATPSLRLPQRARTEKRAHLRQRRPRKSRGDLS